MARTDRDGVATWTFKPQQTVPVQAKQVGCRRGAPW
jgi:hypothetical protein